MDLSHVCSREKINKFVKFTFDIFADNYEFLRSKGYIVGGIVENILKDRSFSKIIGSYIMSEVETSLYGELGFSYELSINTYAIVIQYMSTFCFELNGELCPFVSRGMTYVINDKINDDGKMVVKEFINSLAVGV